MEMKLINLIKYIVNEEIGLTIDQKINKIATNIKNFQKIRMMQVFKLSKYQVKQDDEQKAIQIIKNIKEKRI